MLWVQDVFAGTGVDTCEISILISRWIAFHSSMDWCRVADSNRHVLLYIVIRSGALA